MKTAEELEADVYHNLTWHSKEVPLVNVIRAIQLDAIKFGMTRAVGHVSGKTERDAILNARDNFKLP